MGIGKEISSPMESDDTAELEYFFEILEHFHELVSQPDRPETQKTFRLIARSPESYIARAIFQYRDKFLSNGASFHVIFANLSPVHFLSEWISDETSPCAAHAESTIRWARRPNLVDAHEQFTLNNECTWSGESMRRDVSSRFGFYLFEDACKETAIIAERSFQALWRVSEPIPASQVKRAKLVSESDFANLQSDATCLSVAEPLAISPEFTRH